MEKIVFKLKFMFYLEAVAGHSAHSIAFFHLCPGLNTISSFQVLVYISYMDFNLNHFGKPSEICSLLFIGSSSIRSDQSDLVYWELIRFEYCISF